MSASPVFSSAAFGRPFVLSPRLSSEALWVQLGATKKLPAIAPASRLEVRPTPEIVSSGIRELDALTGGLPRGCLTEICGSASSGRTSILLSALAEATRRGEVCALVDASDALDPASAAAAQIEMSRLLWIRCGYRKHAGTAAQGRPAEQRSAALNIDGEIRRERRKSESQLEQVLKVTDLLLQSNGFGMIALDLGDTHVQSARRIPLASWFRFRRAIEHTPTVLLVIEQQPIAGSCSSVLLQVSGAVSKGSEKKPPAFSMQHSRVPQITGEPLIYPGSPLSATRPGRAELLDKFDVTVELLRSRLERKSPQSVVNFSSRAKWAG